MGKLAQFLSGKSQVQKQFKKGGSVPAPFNKSAAACACGGSVKKGKK